MSSFVEHRERLPKSYFWLLAVNITTGCVQTGFILNSAGINQVRNSSNFDMKFQALKQSLIRNLIELFLELQVLNVQEDWPKDRVEFNQTFLVSLSIFGLMVGSLFSKPILVIGRRLSILICNLIIALMTIPFFFCKAVWILATARFIIGCCAALIVNASSTYIGETAPTAYKPYLGTTI